MCGSKAAHQIYFFSGIKYIENFIRGIRQISNSLFKNNAQSDYKTFFSMQS
jgi:hypothetical protein